MSRTFSRRYRALNWISLEICRECFLPIHRSSAPSLYCIILHCIESHLVVSPLHGRINVQLSLVNVELLVNITVRRVMRSGRFVQVIAVVTNHYV